MNFNVHSQFVSLLIRFVYYNISQNLCNTRIKRTLTFKESRYMVHQISIIKGLFEYKCSIKQD